MSNEETGIAAAVSAEVFKAEPIYRYFGWAHLSSEKLRAVSQPFEELAGRIIITIPRSPERTVALRKLLESKDAAVRAALET